MKVYLLVLAVVFAAPDLRAIRPPDEQKIFFHLHQAIQWAELIYSQDCILSHQEIKAHLKRVKYSNPRLVDSKFYSEYIAIRDSAFEASNTNRGDVEKLRSQLHFKAEELQLKHEDSWQNEFLACSD